MVLKYAVFLTLKKKHALFICDTCDALPKYLQKHITKLTKILNTSKSILKTYKTFLETFPKFENSLWTYEKVRKYCKFLDYS